MDFFLCQDVGQAAPTRDRGNVPFALRGLQWQTWKGLPWRSQTPSSSHIFTPQFWLYPSIISKMCLFCVFLVSFFSQDLTQVSPYSFLPRALFTPFAVSFPAPVLFLQGFHFCCPSCVAGCEEVAHFGTFWASLPPWACFGLCLTRRLCTGSAAAAAEHLCSSVLNPWPVACLCRGLSSGADSSLQSWRQICQACLAELHMLFECSFTLPDRGFILYALFYLVGKKKKTFSHLNIFVVFL